MTDFNRITTRLDRQRVNYDIMVLYDNYVVVCYKTKWLHKSRHRFFNSKGEEITWQQMHKEVAENWD